MSHSSDRTQPTRRGKRGQKSKEERDEERSVSEQQLRRCSVCGNELSTTSDEFCVDCQ